MTEEKKTTNSVCPHCGYCPHCGRGGHAFLPYVPPYTPYYPWYPTYPQVTWCVNGNSSGYVTLANNTTGVAL